MLTEFVKTNDAGIGLTAYAESNAQSGCGTLPLLRIGVLVSGGGSNLQAIIDAIGRREINGEICCVISGKPGVYALERAENAGIPTEVIEKKAFANVDDYNIAMIDCLKSYGADLIVLAGFLSILSERFISAFENRIINVHPSLIPSFCGVGCYGLNVHKKALEKGVKVSGATVHFVTEDCDAGPIILQKAIEVLNDDTPESLQLRIMQQAEWVILPKAIALFCEGRLKIEKNRVIIDGIDN